MKTFTICIIMAFFCLIATIFVMDSRAIFMEPFTISLITAFCSVIGIIFTIETQPVSLHKGVITIKTLSVSVHTATITRKTLSISVKEVFLLIILAIVGTIFSIVVLQNLAVLE